MPVPENTCTSDLRPYRSVLHGVTALSFLAIALFFLWFTLWAPGRYSPGGRPDMCCALLLLANLLCAALSLLDALRVCRDAARQRRLVLAQVPDLLLGLYPGAVLLCLCGGNTAVLGPYLLAPLRILFR